MILLLYNSGGSYSSSDSRISADTGISKLFTGSDGSSNNAATIAVIVVAVLFSSIAFLVIYNRKRIIHYISGYSDKVVNVETSKA